MTHAEMEQSTVTIIAKIKGKGLWKGTFQEGADILQDLLDGLNEVWETNVQLKCKEDNPYLIGVGGGQARGGGREIHLAKISLMTFIHEYYHCLAIQKGLRNNEENAQRWSHMIFKKALPNIYNKAAREGKFFHVVNS